MKMNGYEKSLQEKNAWRRHNIGTDIQPRIISNYFKF